MSNNETYSIKTSKETKDTLRSIPNKTVRAVLDGLGELYENGVQATEVCIIECSLATIDAEIKVHEDAIARLQQLRTDKEEELREAREVQINEEREMDKAWQDIKKYGLGDEVYKKLDYQQIHVLFMNYKLPDEMLIEYCVKKLHHHIDVLNKKQKDERVKAEIKKSETLIEQCERLEYMLATGTITNGVSDYEWE